MTLEELKPIYDAAVLRHRSAIQAIMESGGCVGSKAAWDALEREKHESLAERERLYAIKREMTQR